jgi:hypothetical protein
MQRLFTDRHGGMQPRVHESLDEACRNGLLSLADARISEQWFGLTFPENCPDGPVNAGTDIEKLKIRLDAYRVIWPQEWLQPDKIATDGQVFDLIEFSYEHIAEPKPFSYHDYWKHNHFRYDQERGCAVFEEEVNRLFERNGIAFEFRQGEVIRLMPTGLHEALSGVVFQTGDTVLDSFLEDARSRFLNRDLKIRKESVERLWDAWERLKTLESGKDKQAQAAALLKRACDEPNFRSRLETEARELTEIGNRFMIRHTETNKIQIEKSAHVDYLFQRMFALIRLLLQDTGRLY